MKGFPRIQTTRLLLRPFSLHDLEPLHQLWADADVRRYLWDDDTIAREQVVSEIRKSIINFRKHGFGQWAVLPLGQETLIGFCGLRHFGDPPEVELLCAIAVAYWGQGLATEATQAVLRYGFEEIHLSRILAGADEPNTASLRLMKRIGMSFDRCVQLHGREAVYYGLTREVFNPPDSSYIVQRT